jgi:nitroreductase
MDVYEAIRQRRSIRRFKDKAVPYEALEKCIDAARLAPCGRNHQVGEYIGGSAKQSPEKGGPGPSQKPKAYILVLINKAWEGDANRRRISLLDIGMAAENIILTAYEQGIGACPILMFNEADLRLLLEIPEGHDIALVIAMGYPDESPVTDVAGESLNIYVDNKGVRHVPKRRLADIIHRNGFG